MQESFQWFQIKEKCFSKLTVEDLKIKNYTSNINVRKGKENTLIIRNIFPTGIPFRMGQAAKYNSSSLCKD